MATIKKRGSGYLIRVSCGYDVNGKHMEQSMTWKPDEGMSKRQIQKELNRQAIMFEDSVSHGFKTSAMKFQELTEEWFDSYAKMTLRNTTYARMKQLAVRVNKAIGHLRMDKITPRHIQAFVNSLTKPGANERTGEPLAPKTIRHYLTLISDVFNYGVRMGVVADNPCSKVYLPKNTSKEKQIYSQEEMTIFLHMLADEPIKYRAFFYLIAYTGFRRGEMLGLEWKDVDFRDNIISVRRTSNYTSDKGTYTDTTKTKRSQRTVKIAPEIMSLLRELRDYQEDQAFKIGSKWVENDRLFTSWDGSPMDLNTPYNYLLKFCRAHDLPFYGIHSFRHFAASALISAGLDITTVSGALGHSCSGTTLNTYSHMFQTAQARVAQAMDGAFGFLSSEDT
ncbi:site-specific integrase [Ruminococcus sp.]|uniref:tyrosine-type recombinase/integrase n=1 Tax=Ruminococcus sp. TaxID=41978 RepID=UPI00258FC3B6|nr:site-specific integrase [Ruminococcus sp.]MCR5022081.1 site-specific integrase [Ruminococcus sp.]